MLLLGVKSVRGPWDMHPLSLAWLASLPPALTPYCPDWFHFEMMSSHIPVQCMISSLSLGAMSRLILGQEISGWYSPPCCLLTVWPPLQQGFPPLVIVLEASRHSYTETPICPQRWSPEPMGHWRFSPSLWKSGLAKRPPTDHWDSLFTISKSILSLSSPGCFLVRNWEVSELPLRVFLIWVQW